MLFHTATITLMTKTYRLNKKPVNIAMLETSQGVQSVRLQHVGCTKANAFTPLIDGLIDSVAPLRFHSINSVKK